MSDRVSLSLLSLPDDSSGIAATLFEEPLAPIPGPAVDWRRRWTAASGSVAGHALLGALLVVVSRISTPSLNPAPPQIRTVLVAPILPPAPAHHTPATTTVHPAAPPAGSSVEPQAAQPHHETGKLDLALHEEESGAPTGRTGRSASGKWNERTEGTAVVAGAVHLGSIGGLDGEGSGTNEASLVTTPTPVYTEEARRQHITGSVVLLVKLEKSGAVRCVKVLSGLGYGLDKAAIDAVNGSRCRVAEDSIGKITVEFHLS